MCARACRATAHNTSHYCRERVMRCCAASELRRHPRGVARRAAGGAGQRLLAGVRAQEQSGAEICGAGSACKSRLTCAALHRRAAAPAGTLHSNGRRARARLPPQRLFTKSTYAPSAAQTAIALTVSSSLWSKTCPKMPVAARARVSGMPRQQARGVLCGRAQQQPSSTISPRC